jgi:hemerythrin superfamily protein
MANPTPRDSAAGRAAHGAKVVSSGGGAGLDAIELLKGDHRRVETLFQDYDASDDPDEKRRIAELVCQALTVHAQIEEEVFYPAFLEAGGDEQTWQDATREHEEAKEVIAEIEASDPAQDGSFDARVQALSRMIAHHVRDEEGPEGMFAESARLGLDLEELGAQLEQRKLALMDDATTDLGYDEAVRRDS